MKQPKSGKRILIRIFCIMLAVTLLCLTVCGYYAIYTAQAELEYCNEAALELYFDGLTHIMDDLQDFNEDIYANDYDFTSLALNSTALSTSQTLLHQLNLRRMIQSRTGEITGIFVFSKERSVYYYCYGSSFLGGMVTPAHFDTMHQIMDFWLQQPESNMLVWTPFQTQGHALLMNTTCKRDLYICSMVDLQAYSDAYSGFDSTGHIEYTFYTKDSLLTNTDYASKNGIALDDILNSPEKGSYTAFHKHLLQSRFNPENGIGLCGIISMTGMWGNLKVFVIMQGVALVIICILFAAMYSTLNSMLIYPMKQITAASQKIANGEESIDTTREQILELEEIRAALSNLVEQKVSLERDNISQAYQKEHALLQYYQLQTRSHFFLNCLKSIYNLTARGELEKTQQIITLFSNHIRYVFHDSLSFVTVQAELDEVNDYFRILQLERSDAILLNQNVDPELLGFQIPPLIIQTFLENFNKFNAPGSKILRFSIRIDQVEMDNSSYVRLRLSDNGVGYSEEALQMVDRPDHVFERYHVGIQNLCRRMDILYKKHYQIAFFNNPTGGACSVIYLPLDQKGGTV